MQVKNFRIKKKNLGNEIEIDKRRNNVLENFRISLSLKKVYKKDAHQKKQQTNEQKSQ